MINSSANNHRCEHDEAEEHKVYHGTKQADYGGPSVSNKTGAQAVEEASIATESAEITALPELTVPLASEKEMDKVSKLVDLLEDHDDVQEVYSNAAFEG